MKFVEVSSLPEILFSHVYQADSYHNHLVLRQNFLEVSYIAEGSSEFRIGNNSFHVKKGDVVCDSHRQETIVSAKKFHCHHTVGATVQWTVSTDEQSSLLLPTITPAENNTASICYLIDEMIHNQTAYKTSKTLGAAKFLELLCAIDACNRKKQNMNLPSELRYAKQAKDYILQNLHVPITQAVVAAHLGISPEYLCAVFKKAEGTTVMRYVNKHKLENIKALLEHTNIRLYEAAAMYGYNDPNYVSRLYKQLFGYNITDRPHIHPPI